MVRYNSVLLRVQRPGPQLYVLGVCLRAGEPAGV